MRTIALINQKGGVGKTTTAVNLSACLAKLGKSVILIDLDPQGNSSSWLGVNINKLEKSMFNVFHDDLPISAILRETCVENMWVVPSNVTLAAIERILANKLENDTILRRSISLLPEQYDYVILDCPPSLGLLTVNALSAVKEVFIPLETKVLALNGLVTLVNTVNLVKDKLNPDLKVTGIIACMFDIRTNLSNQVVATIKEKFHDKLFRSIIRANTQLAECPISGQPITMYAPESRGTEDYMNLAREVIEGEKGNEQRYDEGENGAGQHTNDGYDENEGVPAFKRHSGGEERENDHRHNEGEQENAQGCSEGESETLHHLDEGRQDDGQQNNDDEKKTAEDGGKVERDLSYYLDIGKKEILGQDSDVEEDNVNE